MKKLLAILIIISGICLYLFAPLKYNFNYNVVCGLFYICVVIIFYLVKRKKNYLDFDSLFFFTYFFVTLYYPIFMFESDASRYFMFAFPFKEKYIPLGSGMAILGISSYISGNLLYNNKKQIKNITNSQYRTVNNSFLYIIALITFVLYIFTGGYSELQAYYSGEKVKEAVGFSYYFFLFSPAFLFSAIIIEFFNLKSSSKTFSFKGVNKLGLVITLFILCFLLFAGSRTVPLQIILIILGLYSLFFKSFTFLKFLGSLIFGIFLMFLVVVLRGYTQNDKFEAADLVMDLVINNRSSYIAIEVVNRDGLTYGENMISPLAAPIPFLQSVFVQNGFKEDYISSSRFFTFYTLGKFDGFGLGTNMIADIFLSFGSLGIVILMFLLGYFISKINAKAVNNIYYLTAYAIFISYAVYLVRAEFFFFLRYMIWCLIIVFFSVNKFKLSK